jgi:DNA-binding transcriptional ArsR family regulator
MQTLEGLFSSRVRLAVLKVLLGRPKERFYGRELARLSGERQSAVWRELQNLEQVGLVEKIEDANLTYFRADSDHPLFRELHLLFVRALQLSGEPVPASVQGRTMTSKIGLSLRRRPQRRDLIVGETD